MMIQIVSDETRTNEYATHRSITLATEKVEIFVDVMTGSKYGDEVRVIVKNASHRVWRGAGKRFDTMDEAIANYRSAAVRSMLETVQAMTSGVAVA